MHQKWIAHWSTRAFGNEIQCRKKTINIKYIGSSSPLWPCNGNGKSLLFSNGHSFASRQNLYQWNSISLCCAHPPHTAQSKCYSRLRGWNAYHDWKYFKVTIEKQRIHKVFMRIKHKVRPKPHSFEWRVNASAASRRGASNLCWATNGKCSGFRSSVWAYISRALLCGLVMVQAWHLIQKIPHWAQ